MGRVAYVFFNATGVVSIIPEDTVIFTLPDEIAPSIRIEFGAWVCTNQATNTYGGVNFVFSQDGSCQIVGNSLSRGSVSCIFRIY